MTPRWKLNISATAEGSNSLLSNYDIKPLSLFSFPGEVIKVRAKNQANRRNLSPEGREFQHGSKNREGRVGSKKKESKRRDVITFHPISTEPSGRQKMVDERFIEIHDEICRLDCLPLRRIIAGGNKKVRGF